MAIALQIPQDKFPALTGIRAIAAFMVFFDHLPFHLHFTALMQLQHTMHIGVTLFFVLSGFLIIYRYYARINLSPGWLMTYFVNRFARIYPVYFLLTTIVIVFWGRFDLIYLIQNYTLTYPLFRTPEPAIGASWSLIVEECFYITAPIIILLTRRYHILLPFFITAILSIAWLTTTSTGNNVITGRFPAIMFTYAGRFTEFFTGAAMAVFILKRRMRYLKKKMENLHSHLLV